VPSPSAVHGGIPPTLESIDRKALAPNPEERFASAAEMASRWRRSSARSAGTTVLERALPAPLSWAPPPGLRSARQVLRALPARQAREQQARVRRAREQQARERRAREQAGAAVGAAAAGLPPRGRSRAWLARIPMRESTTPGGVRHDAARPRHRHGPPVATEEEERSGAARGLGLRGSGDRRARPRRLLPIEVPRRAEPFGVARAQVSVPNLVGKTFEEAQQAASAVGLTVQPPALSRAPQVPTP
jgi:hypothetical protein